MKKNNILFIAVPVMIVLGLFIVYKYGYRGVRADLTAVREEQTVKAKLLQKYIALIAEKPGLEKRISELRDERKADDSRLIEGQTPSLAAATLQETVKGIIVEKGGTVLSERVGKPEDHGKFKIITVSIDAALPNIASLSEILYSIETRTPYLVVKELDTRVRNIRAPKDLTIKMDVAALTGGK